MGIARGPNIITEDLVFGYDTGYGIANNNTATRFYPGQPSVNLFGDISNANARPNRTEYNTSAWTANFPKPPEDVGRVYSHTSGSLSSTWSGNSYGYTLISYSYLANTTYTLSCWVYVSTDCNIGALHQSMEGTTLTNTTNRWYDLNNKGTWQQLSIRCNSSSAVNGNAIIAYPSRSGVTNGSHTGFWAIGGAKLEINDQVTPYVLGTRSDTASLIDLKRTNSIDVSDMSFTSTGQPEFDGTDDIIGTGISTAFTDFSCVVVFKHSVNTAWGRIVDKNYTNGFFMSSYWASVGSGYVGAGIIEPSSPHGQSLQYDNTKYNYFVVTRSGTTHTIYLNGSSNYASKTGSGAALNSAEIHVGAWYTNSSSQRFTGSIPVVKIYDRALTATEVQQDFGSYKNRFNI